MFEQDSSGGMVAHVRGNLAILAGLEAQRQGDAVGAAQAFEVALRLFEANKDEPVPWDDGRIDYMRQLLASVQGTTTQQVGSPN